MTPGDVVAVIRREQGDCDPVLSSRNMNGDVNDGFHDPVHRRRVRCTPSLRTRTPPRHIHSGRQRGPRRECRHYSSVGPAVYATTRPPERGAGRVNTTDIPAPVRTARAGDGPRGAISGTRRGRSVPAGADRSLVHSDQGPSVPRPHDRVIATLARRAGRAHVA